MSSLSIVLIFVEESLTQQSHAIFILLPHPQSTEWYSQGYEIWFSKIANDIMHELKVTKKKINEHFSLSAALCTWLSLTVFAPTANLFVRETERSWWRLSTSLCSVHDVTITYFSRFFSSPWEESLNPILKIKKKLIFSITSSLAFTAINNNRIIYLAYHFEKKNYY